MPETISTMLAQNFTTAASVTAYVTDQDSAATTIDAGSDNAILPQATIFVADTTSLSAAGLVKITTTNGDEYITYTGKGAGVITGCTGGTGKVYLGDDVVQARVVTFAAGIYRIFLAATGGAGTEASPIEYLKYAQSVIRGAHSRWTVGMAATNGIGTGKVRIRNTGAGTGTIYWVSTVTSTLLGHPTTQITLASNAAVDGTYPPTHCIFSNARANDSGPKTAFAGFAGSEPASNIPDVLASAAHVVTRTFELLKHPTRPADATSLGSVLTPMLPDDADYALMTTPSDTPIVTFRQWTVQQFLDTAIQNRAIAMSPGYFQALVNTSQTTYDVGRLGTETRKGNYSYSAPNFKRRTDRSGIVFNFVSSGTVA